MSSKITIIGAGSVGSTIAYTLSNQDIASEIVLIDINKEKVAGEVMDIIQESFSVPILMVPEMQLYVEDVTTTFLRSLERRHRQSDLQSSWMNS